MRERLAASPWSVLAWVAVIALFLATRIVFLDRDLPPWPLAQYQPIDEFGYALPAFNLHHYGTWTHQEVPWVPLEGAPVNVLQSAFTAVGLAASWTYWGFRAPSVLFGLVAFAALVAVVRHLVSRARADAAPLPFPHAVPIVAAVLLLLADFGFLVAGRVVEPTIGRVAVLGLLLWLIARGTFLGEGHTGRRSIVLGILAGLAAGFGYIYSAFLLPSVVIMAAWWGWHRGGAGLALRHAALAAVGCAAAMGAYFAIAYAVYGDSPAAWYDRWLSIYRETGRADAFDLSQLWGLAIGNSVRLDRPLGALVLAMLPIFAWWAVRARDRLGVTVLVILAVFTAQSAFQSDYPQRKMLILLPLLLPVAVGGVLRFGEWLAATAGTARGLRLRAAWVAWVAIVVAGTIALTLPPRLMPWGPLPDLLGMPPLATLGWTGAWGRAVVVGGIVGVAALVVLLASWRRPVVARVAGTVLLLAMLVPLAGLDVRYVLTHRSYSYRDAMIDLRPTIDGTVTAGGSSYALQLYNTSRPVLQGYVFGMPYAEYQAAVVRFFREGRASYLFGYADPGEPSAWAPLGFRLVDTLDMELPQNHVMGMYVFDPGSAARP